MKKVSPVIKRLTTESKEIIEAAKVEIKYLNFSKGKELSMKFKSLPDSVSADNTRVLGNLWHYAWFLNPDKPLWNGFMKSCYGDLNQGKSAIHFLPMIDMKATEYVVCKKSRQKVFERHCTNV